MSKEKSAELIYSHSRSLLENHEATNRLITTKASILLGFNGAVWAFTMPVNVPSVSQVMFFLFWLMSVCTIISVLLCLVILKGRKWDNGPRIDRASEIIDRHEYYDAVMWLAQANEIADKNNVECLAKKTTLFIWAVTLSSASIILKIALQAVNHL